MVFTKGTSVNQTIECWASHEKQQLPKGPVAAFLSAHSIRTACSTIEPHVVSSTADTPWPAHAAVIYTTTDSYATFVALSTRANLARVTEPRTDPRIVR